MIGSVDGVPSDLSAPPINFGLEGEAALLHHASRGSVIDSRDADDAPEADVLEPEADALERSLRGQPLAPKLRRKLKADLPLVGLRPVVEQV